MRTLFFIYIFPNSLRRRCAINYGVGTWHLCSEYHKKYFIYMHNARIIYIYNNNIYVYISSRFDIFVYKFFCAFHLRQFFADRHCSFFCDLRTKNVKITHMFRTAPSTMHVRIKSVWAYILRIYMGTTAIVFAYLPYLVIYLRRRIYNTRGIPRRISL